MNEGFIAVGALSALLAVASGAFGAHALRQRLSVDMLNVFEIGVRYQMYHALALLVVGMVSQQMPGTLIAASGWLFIAGTLLFSGSLYLLSLTGIRWLGAITPIGGLAFLGGWLCVALAALA